VTFDAQDSLYNEQSKDFKCAFPQSAFRYTTIHKGYNAWPINKNFKYSEDLKKAMTWLKAYGLTYPGKRLSDKEGLNVHIDNVTNSQCHVLNDASYAETFANLNRDTEECSKNAEIPTKKPLSLLLLKLAFGILVAGLTASFAIFILEFLFAKKLTSAGMYLNAIPAQAT
jgi:hypothetical protein